MLDKGVALLVYAVNDLGCFFGCEILLRSDTVDTGITICNDEQVQRIGVSLENMETYATNNNATLFFIVIILKKNSVQFKKNLKYMHGIELT